MSKRQPLSSEAMQALHDAMLRACQYMERKAAEEAKVPAGVLAQLDEQPREG